ncbi:MAG: TIGR02117 family protein [Flavobacteriaceae bacterium]|jgi:uncharacterized protein (TIGR02117 family)|nr:TIGR02117 family protein [Flavobacteriaceae bacterium]
MKKVFRFGKWFAICFLSFVVLYIILFTALSAITVGKQEVTITEKTIPIYLSTNGVHTDFILPVSNTIVNWKEELGDQYENTAWLGFGWGDRGFYIDTPEWKDLKASTAINAMFGLGKSAMHVTQYSSIVADEDCVLLYVTDSEYRSLVDYIKHSFNRTEDGKPIVVNALGYSRYDKFYEAIGNYSMFYTCNSWANEGLKKTKQPAALWTLTDWGIFRNYR